MNVLLVDMNKCNGCYNCQIACKDEHVGNDWPPIAKSQPDIGHFWLKLTDIVQGSVPKVRVRYMVDMCQHCDEAVCIRECRSQAIYKRDDGIVIIDPDKCTGNRDCLRACPYNAVYFNEKSGIAQKCTMCAHLLDEGWKEPRCVDACPTGALKFGREEDMRDQLADAELLKPEHGAQPRVYYKVLPNKYFIAGAVYDPEEDEVLEGALVTLINVKTGAFSSIVTDLFGDFWFERQPPGVYRLKIEMEGYLPEILDSIDVPKDLNVGDIAIRKK